MENLFLRRDVIRLRVGITPNRNKSFYWRSKKPAASSKEPPAVYPEFAGHAQFRFPASYAG
jgi:hypothetical protein